MFDIGWTELVLIAIVILFAFGPEDIPKLMYGFGRVMRRFRYMRYALSSQFEDFMEKAEKSSATKPAATPAAIDKDPEGDDDSEYMDMLPPPDQLPAEKLLTDDDDRPQPAIPQPLTETNTPVIEHLVELRKRLIVCMLALFAMTGLCYVFVDHILAVLIEPLANTMNAEGGTQRLIYTSLTEAFFTTLKLSFLSALFLTLPFILIQIWKFVAPGLYKREQGAFLPFLIATPVLFILGGLLVYFFVMPLAWTFFLGFQTTGVDTVLPIQLEARIGDYLNLIISLIFAFGLCFQLPVLLMLLARAGFVKAADLASKRKYALVIAFIIGAVLTPPDIISQTLLAVPILALYEASILLIRHMEKSRAAQL